MREILFRGKRIDNGEWICSGNIFHLNENGGEYYIPNINTKCTTTHECNSIGEYGNISAIVCKNDTRLYKVNPETVGQFTGLTDKNGKKIFEGDIVKVSHGGSTYYAKIEWDDGSFWVANHDIQMPSYISEVSKTYLEIIGNIHDNPELLEATK